VVNAALLPLGKKNDSNQPQRAAHKQPFLLHKNHTTCGFYFYLPAHWTYFFPFLLAFFASISCFATKRAGDLYGRLEVFFFGLNAIIRVMALVYSNFG
jgi:hypothetical protein